ncbi:hypothetical protein LTR66_007258 [Elasticomyces elasticus]|nr:hypothetical protein LTR66_007258 [Elasticomyces elasticus]
MLRYRRYRVFLLFAVIALFGLYRFTRVRDWNTASKIAAGSLQHFRIKPTTPKTSTEPGSAKDVEEEAVEKLQVPVISSGAKKVHLETSATSIRQGVVKVSSSTKRTVSTPTPTPSNAATVPEQNRGNRQTSLARPDIKPAPQDNDVAESGEGRLEVQPAPVALDIPTIRWSRQEEHFPVSSTIQLPSGTPNPIPRIQHNFKRETEAQKRDRLTRLRIIKDCAAHAWNGYKQQAWMHDEVLPVSGGRRDPFCGWAATLVDSLDTLWIMGMKDDFEEAVDAVRHIDFTTSPRKDIPLFETTIRYLGGLLAAYDVSGAKYRVLLDKAVELAEILMGAFDTPNRMPVTFYYWMPTFASQPHRASTRVVLAELGSLSVEFTRLAQLTREPKYYDAIDRITDAFQVWQNSTRIPGMWPIYVDASGCEKPAQIAHSVSNGPSQATIGHEMVGQDVIAGLPVQHNGDGKAVPADVEADTQVRPPTEASNKMSEDNEPGGMIGSDLGRSKVSYWDDSVDKGKRLAEIDAKAQLDASKHKRQLDGMIDTPAGGKNVKLLNGSLAYDARDLHSKDRLGTKSGQDVCVPQGLSSPSSFGGEQYTLGGMSDSVYEYLPKEFILLGGLESKYQSMYEKSVETIIDKLLFRPMTPENHDILMSGTWRAFSEPDKNGLYGNLSPNGEHLTCFAGGMFALGAKIFDRPGDLEIGTKLTEGCVWAYDATATGIMPETFLAVPCENSNDCMWNETRYWEFLDPYEHSRTKLHDAASVRTAPNQTSSVIETSSDKMLAAVATSSSTNANIKVGIQKRQLDYAPEEVPDKLKAQSGQPKTQGTNQAEQSEAGSPVTQVDAPSTSLAPTPRALYTPQAPLSHQEYVKARIKEERLPPGFSKITSKKYILRPEAIESVFYLYRITGDQHWRDVGWRMFKAIQDNTYAQYGNSAIDDVTKTAPELENAMESFWLAETLKYFFLLFSEESLLSLDDWVLNTEAHPLRRPK